MNTSSKQVHNELEQEINLILEKNFFNNNSFFYLAKEKNKIKLSSAYKIAYNWREITKTFLFTSIRGLGFLAEKIGQEKYPIYQLLSVLQTSFQIISDDLGNNNKLFESTHGTKSIHYIWWEETILKPLSLYTAKKNILLSNETSILIQKMNKTSSNYLGVCVQLRVVETIALQICLTFFHIFSRVEHHGIKIFQEKNLTWITSHIKAETIHRQKVCNNISGMSKIVLTFQEKEQIIKLIYEYCTAWSNAINSFSNYL